jgi:hypothetical protein
VNSTKNENAGKGGFEMPDPMALLPVFQAAMDHEAASVNNYQQLLMVVQTVLLATVLAILQWKKDYVSGVTVVGLAAIISLFLFGIPCEYRRTNADRWRTRIVRLVDSIGDPRMVEAFKASRYDWAPVSSQLPPKVYGPLARVLHAVGGHLFERVILTGVGVGWTILIWQYGPLWARIVATTLMVVWLAFLVLTPFIEGQRYQGSPR